jgi:hypothetical protein
MIIERASPPDLQPENKMKIQIISTESPESTLAQMGAKIEGNKLAASDGLTRYAEIIQRRAGIDCIESVILIAREPISAHAAAAAIRMMDAGPLPADRIVNI